MDYSLLGSSVHGIFQARVLEWGAIAFFIPYVSISQTVIIYHLAANSPEYLVLPEPLRLKQLHHLHTWPSQGQTQVL